MKEDILVNFDDPQYLEKLYRENKAAFKKAFNALYPEIKDHKIANFWHERLNYESSDISWGTNSELVFTIIVSLLAGILAKLPNLLYLDTDLYYSRNIGFIVFPFLMIYFAWKKKISVTNTAVAAIITFAALIFINSLPESSESDTLTLACIHLPLFLWAVLGFTFVGNKLQSYEKRLEFLRYNGDLVVMTSLILLAGILLTGITVGLFSLVSLDILNFYYNYIIVFGLAASPIVGTYIIQANPQLVNKVSPVIAKIFSPIVLITLVVYLFAIIVSDKDPYNDREFLLTFNVLLIGVMAIIFFSIAETSKKSKSRFGSFVLFLLSATTVIVNGIALSAILFRISEWGITPNRIAVLGGNILMLTNLLVVVFELFRVLKDEREIEEVGRSITMFLPVYSLWTVIVVFLFPLFFSFK